MSRAVTVLLADDHSLVRGALAQWLRANSDVEVVSEVGDAAAAIEEAVRTKPDVVVMDIDMPGLLCFDAARTIKARCPTTRVVFLSAFFHDRYIEEALSVEASGYLTKGEPPESVLEAIRTVAGGGVYFSADVQDRLVVNSGGVKLANKPKTVASTLTSREIEVLRYIARGMSKKEIGTTMNLSVKTIDNHCSSLMNKLDIHDRVELARFAIREGLAEP